MLPNINRVFEDLKRDWGSFLKFVHMVTYFTMFPLITVVWILFQVFCVMIPSNFDLNLLFPKQKSSEESVVLVKTYETARVRDKSANYLNTAPGYFLLNQMQCIFDNRNLTSPTSKTFKILRVRHLITVAKVFPRHPTITLIPLK